MRTGVSLEQARKGVEIGTKIESCGSGKKAEAALEGESPESCGGFVGFPAFPGVPEAREAALSALDSARGSAKARTALLRWGASPWVSSVDISAAKSGSATPERWNAARTIADRAYRKDGAEEGAERMRSAWRWCSRHGSPEALLRAEGDSLRRGLAEMSPAEGVLSPADERALRKARIWGAGKAQRDACLSEAGAGAEEAKALDEMAREAIGRKAGAAKPSEPERPTGADLGRIKSLKMLAERSAEDTEGFYGLWSISPRIRERPLWAERRFGSMRETLLGTAMRASDKRALREMLEAGANPWRGAANDEETGVHVGRNPFAWAAWLMPESPEDLDIWARACLRGAREAFGEDPKSKCEAALGDARGEVAKFRNEAMDKAIAMLRASLQSLRLGEAAEEGKGAGRRKRTGL